jgi:hypothetical protein
MDGEKLLLCYRVEDHRIFPSRQGFPHRTGKIERRRPRGYDHDAGHLVYDDLQALADIGYVLRLVNSDKLVSGGILQYPVEILRPENLLDFDIVAGVEFALQLRSGQEFGKEGCFSDAPGPIDDERLARPVIFLDSSPI